MSFSEKRTRYVPMSLGLIGGGREGHGRGHKDSEMAGKVGGSSQNRCLTRGRDFRAALGRGRLLCGSLGGESGALRADGSNFTEGSVWHGGRPLGGTRSSALPDFRVGPSRDFTSSLDLHRRARFAILYGSDHE